MATPEDALGEITRVLVGIKQPGITTTLPRKHGYAYTSEVKQAGNRVIVHVYFGKKGTKLLLQGDTGSPLASAVKAIHAGAPMPQTQNALAEEYPYIGIDESGKGDLFGPLVIAAFCATRADAAWLKQLGVTDSKLMAEGDIRNCAETILAQKREQISILRLMPEKYNNLYAKTANLNKLLGWGHAQVINSLTEKFTVKHILSDKFGNTAHVTAHLSPRSAAVPYHAAERGERFIAVAAASVLARYGFLYGMKELQQITGNPLPKGAGADANRYLKAYIAKNGTASLKSIGKLHFKNFAAYR